MYDILLVSIPKLSTDSPLLALGQLKAQVQSHGYTCKTIDFNMWLYQQTKDTELAHIWDPLDNTLMDEELLTPIRSTIEAFSEQFILEQIIPHSPVRVGMTAFSLFTFPMLNLFSTVLRKYYNGDIILGGPALTSAQHQNIDLVNQLVEKDLVTDFISGDAEHSIIEYLQGNREYPGINNYEYNNSFDRNELPYPDYSDFDLTLYRDLHISGSRGCVRKCTFCNVPLLWPKFTSKTGERIANEIIHYYENYNIRRFRLVDSLVNGNQKVFLDFIQRLADYNSEHDSDIAWSGQFIVRPKHQVPESVFDLIKASGNENLTIGVESGSEKIRADIKKPFTNADLIYHMEQFDRTNLEFSALMFVGFPTENDQDFEETLDLLEVFSRFKSVAAIGCEHPMLIIPGTPVHMHMEDFGITSYTDYFEWSSDSNNYKKRIERFLIFTDVCAKYNLNHKLVTGISNIFVEHYLNNVTEQDSKILEVIERNFR